MSTNLNLLGLIQVMVTTGNNEDWLDGISWVVSDTDQSPIDLAGIFFDSQVRHVALDHTAFLSLDTGTSGGLIVTDNNLSFAVPALEMSHLTAGDYVFDIRAHADGETRVVVQGSLTLTEGVTRR